MAGRLYGLMCLWHGLSPEKSAWIASKEWLSTWEHRRWAYDVMKRGRGMCDLCGRRAGEPGPDGTRTVLNADHIHPRKRRPWLALDRSNGQVLCAFHNAGKGNRDSTDWR